MTNIEIPRQATSAIERAAKFEAMRRGAGHGLVVGTVDVGAGARARWWGPAEGRFRTEDRDRRRTDFGVLEVVGGFVFNVARRFDPARGSVNPDWYHSWLYTFDLLLPVVSLRHSDLWVPLGAARWLSLAFTVVGWALAICLVTGVGRLFKRDER